MISVAVIGTGSMGHNHARVYSELAEARLVGIADEDPIIMKKSKRDFGVPGFTDYRQMLELTKPEAVSIAVPTALHEHVAQTVLESGADVLVEKPIAATMESGRRLNDYAVKKGRLLMVGHIVRFNPAIQALKNKLQNGDLGRIFQIIARRVGPFPARIRDVGVVIDLATHDLDLIRFLTGLEPIRVYAETEQHIHTDHEDLLLGMMRLQGNVSALLEINWLTPTKVREVLVLGERGLFRVDDLNQDLYYYENEMAATGSAHHFQEDQELPTLPHTSGRVLWSNLQNIKGVSEGSMTRYALQRYEPLKAELQAFLKAIGEGAPAPVTGEDGLAALQLALALVESGHSHQVIELS